MYTSSMGRHAVCQAVMALVGMKYIANISLGKDSLAMILLLMEKRYPIDEVIFYDTEMEFQAIYKNCQRLSNVLSDNTKQTCKPFLGLRRNKEALRKPPEGAAGDVVQLADLEGTVFNTPNIPKQFSKDNPLHPGAFHLGVECFMQGDRLFSIVNKDIQKYGCL